MAFFSVRKKILVSVLAITSLFALIMVVVAETAVRERLRGMLQDKGSALARKVAEECVSPTITERYFEIAMMFKDLKSSQPDVVYAFVLGEDGRALVHTFPGRVPEELKRAHPVPLQKPSSARELATDEGTVLDIGVPLLKGHAGVLRIGFSEAPIRRDVNRITLLILSSVGGALLVGTLAAVALSRLITKPLLKLTQAAEAFGRGETRQPVVIRSADEIGELASVFNLMVEKRQRAEEEREELIAELRQALSEVKTLRGFLPICSSCKKIRDDEGYWRQIETYIQEHSDAAFSHGICPECAKELYPEYWERIQRPKV